MADNTAAYARIGKRECHKAAETVAEFIATSPLTPTETGRLRNSFSAEDTLTGAALVSSAYYWVYVEFGDYNNAPQPFVRPALEEFRAMNT